MARPRKNGDDVLLQLVNRYFSEEAGGNTSLLKCSLLEEYAASQGVNAKAYDFRRSVPVRMRIDELKELAKNENGLGILSGSAYKSLDITALLASRRNPQKLSRVIGELDDYWKSVYAQACHIVSENKGLKDEIRFLKMKNEETEEKLQEAERCVREQKSREIRLEQENRYLRSQLKRYLYPALANEILFQEHEVDTPEVRISEKARKELIDGTAPSSIAEVMGSDNKNMNRAEQMLEGMWTSTIRRKNESD